MKRRSSSSWGMGMSNLNKKPHVLVVPRDSILGRMNCNWCRAWRYLYEFPNHRRVRGNKVHIYIRGHCRVCEAKRVIRWKEKQPDLRAKQKRYYDNRRRKLRLTDIWPIRRWVIMKLAAGESLESISWNMDVSQGVVRDIFRGYRVGLDGLPHQLKTIELEMLEHIIKSVREHDESRTRERNTR